MTVIQRVPSPSEPITVTIGDSTYTIDPFDKAANLAGAIAAGEAREKGLSEAKQMLFRRIGEVVEMMRGWTNVKFDDGPDAEFNTVNAYALFLSDDGDNIAISLWSAANSAREKVDAQKKSPYPR